MCCDVAGGHHKLLHAMDKVGSPDTMSAISGLNSSHYPPPTMLVHHSDPARMKHYKSPHQIPVSPLFPVDSYPLSSVITNHSHRYSSISPIVDSHPFQPTFLRSLALSLSSIRPLADSPGGFPWWTHPPWLPTGPVSPPRTAPCWRS